ncbi:MAG: hypothetical protein JNJ85_00810 [Candidatus Kapabacteria bacterium]|nr:hypothetical protein [Candidatus Kapabacteria bacterium]
MKSFVILATLFILTTVPIWAHPEFSIFPSNPKICFNIGYRFGDYWGTNEGEMSGVEFSITYLNKNQNLILGLVLNSDKTYYGRKQSIALQVSNKFGGASIGPTFINQKDSSSVAITTTLFTGFLIYPAYSLSIGTNAYVTHEVSVAFKIPLVANTYPDY